VCVLQIVALRHRNGIGLEGDAREAVEQVFVGHEGRQAILSDVDVRSLYLRAGLFGVAAVRDEMGRPGPHDQEGVRSREPA